MKNDTHWIITYCHSIVNIARVSYRNCYYLYYRDIKQQKGKLVVIAHWPTMIILLYIWFILNCNGNFSHKYWICGIFNILCHNFLKRSNKSINFDFDQQQQVHNTKLLVHNRLNNTRAIEIHKTPCSGLGRSITLTGYSSGLPKITWSEVIYVWANIYLTTLVWPPIFLHISVFTELG